MAEIAQIAVGRDDRMTDHDMNALQASIVNPAGKLPKGSLERVQEAAEERYSAAELRNGEKRLVGVIEYEDGGDIVGIRFK